MISLNAISASHAVNDFSLDYLSLRQPPALYYEQFHFLKNSAIWSSRVKTTIVRSAHMTGFGMAGATPSPFLVRKARRHDSCKSS